MSNLIALRKVGVSAALIAGAVFALPAAAQTVCGASSSSTSCQWTSIGTSSAPVVSHSYSAATVPAGLCKVACPVTVDLNPGERVIDCYARCQPKPVSVSYQVVRPVIVQRVPVPVYVPPRTVVVPAPCQPVRTVYLPDSRYGYDGYARRGCR